jgi:tetratricopeptide (TPR) repeat protein
LTGERPFKGANTEAVVYSILHDEPPQLASLRVDVPGELGIIVANALEKDPEERYQTAQELVTDLTAVAARLRKNEQSPALAQISRKRRAKEAARLRRRLGTAARRWWATVPVAAAVVAAAIMGVTQMIGRLSGPMLDPNRVVVTVFQNRTGDSDLDHMGPLITDWIAEGILQSGLADLVPEMTVSEYVGGKEVRFTTSSDRNRVMMSARQVGAGVAISGTCRAAGDSIRLQCSLVDVGADKIVNAVTSGGLTRDGALMDIEEFRQRIIGSLAAHFMSDVVFATPPNPPYFEAFQHFVAGLTVWLEDLPAARDHMTRATVSDSTFIDPYLWLAIAELWLDQCAVGKEICTSLEGRREKLLPVHRYLVGWLRAVLEGKRKEAWRHLKQAELVNSDNYILNHLLVEEAVWTNQPRTALEVAREVDPPELVYHIGILGSMYLYRLADAWHMLGEYKRELELGREAAQSYPDLIRPRMAEARALAALGRVDELSQVIAECPISDPQGLTARSVMIHAVGVLRTHGHLNAAQEIADKVVAWYRGLLPSAAQGEDHRYDLARALYMAERWTEARTLFEELLAENPDDFGLQGYLGALAACLGDREEALRITEHLRSVNRPCSFGYNTYCAACILSILGERERATDTLGEAFNKGHTHGPLMLNDPLLLPLRGYGPFEELIRPKG